MTSSNIGVRYCSVHNATVATIEFNHPFEGPARLYYNPDERRLPGSFTQEKCKKWCYRNTHCDLALWFSKAEECHVYRFRSKKRNEKEILEHCVPSGANFFPDTLYGIHGRENLCPLEKAITISCTSYQGQCLSHEKY